VATCDILDLCVEVTTDPEDENTILIRESEFPDAVVRTSRVNWEAFVDGVKNGNFDNV
jgi:hypothetical protein